MNQSTNAPRERDAATLRILGIFFLVLAVLVLVGTLWTLGDRRATIVNIGSGLVLAAVGAGMVFAAHRLIRRQRSREGKK